MDVREKLVEILAGCPCESDREGMIGSCPNRRNGNCNEIFKLSYCAVSKLAQHLIAHGVTVQEWISVTERLPEFTEEEIERYRFFGDTFFPEFNVMILGATQPTTLYCDGEKWYDEECHCYCVTHWQCLPQPPKGE